MYLLGSQSRALQGNPGSALCARLRLVPPWRKERRRGGEGAEEGGEHLCLALSPGYQVDHNTGVKRINRGDQEGMPVREELWKDALQKR